MELKARPLLADVVRVDFGGCLLLGDDGDLIEASVRARLMGPTKALGNTLVVGDRAHFERDHDRAVVCAVEPRRNLFSRRASGRHAAEQVVAANLDQVVLVASIAEPEFKAGLADRVLCQAEHAGLPARLVISKIDLGDRKEAQAILDDYARAGYAGQWASVRTREGIEHLQHACRGRRSLFVGHSGVGKSTLLNALAPGLELFAGHVNPKTGKGRHTTSAAWLIRAQDDIDVIDTPGVRAFGLWGITSRDLEQSYPDFRRYLGECRFSNCRHERDPGCAVRAGVDGGHIAPRRYQSFLKLRDELEGEGSRR